MVERLTYENEWLDNLVTTCKQIWSELGKETFRRYREIGKHILTSGYKKGQWKSKHKKLFQDKLNISQQTFSNMVILGEMNDLEFTSVTSNFTSYNAWTHQSKSTKENFFKEKRIDIATFENEEQAKMWFKKYGGLYKGCYYIGTVDIRIFGENINE